MHVTQNSQQLAWQGLLLRVLVAPVLPRCQSAQLRLPVTAFVLAQLIASLTRSTNGKGSIIGFVERVCQREMVKEATAVGERSLLR